MTIYKKTAKCMNELMARRSSIDSNLNGMLLLVDGERTESEIRRLGLLIQMPLDGPEILLHGGYLEVVEAPQGKADSLLSQPVPTVQSKSASTPAPVRGQDSSSVADNQAHVEAFSALHSGMVKNPVRCWKYAAWVTSVGWSKRAYLMT